MDFSNYNGIYLYSTHRNELNNTTKSSREIDKQKPNIENPKKKKFRLRIDRSSLCVRVCVCALCIQISVSVLSHVRCYMYTCISFYVCVYSNELIEHSFLLYKYYFYLFFFFKKGKKELALPRNWMKTVTRNTIIVGFENEEINKMNLFIVVVFYLSISISLPLPPHSLTFSLSFQCVYLHFSVTRKIRIQRQMQWKHKGQANNNNNKKM